MPGSGRLLSCSGSLCGGLFSSCLFSRLLPGTFSRGAIRRRRRKLHTLSSRFGKTDRNCLPRVLRATLVVLQLVHFFVNKFTGLCCRSFSLFCGLLSAADSFL